jgi:LacI family transcriptional regulator
MNIKAVAAKARVSTATISRTINRSSAVHPKTAKRIWRVIQQLGYYPNVQARALVSGRSRLFGLIVSDICNPFFPEVVKSFQEAALHQGYEVIVGNTDYDAERTRTCVRRMIERKVDGVAVLTSEIAPGLLEQITQRRCQTVFLGSGRVGPFISDISVDYAKGIQEALRHLLSLGHRRFGFISGPAALRSARVRRAVFLKCLREHGIANRDQVIVEGNHRVDGGELATQQVLAHPRGPTAILTSNDLTAIGALRAIRNAGRRIPTDVSLVGFDDIELAQYANPPLTTVRLSREELGRKAFDALHRSVEDSSSGARRISVSTSLIIRESTAEARYTKNKSSVHRA